MANGRHVVLGGLRVSLLGCVALAACNYRVLVGNGLGVVAVAPANGAGLGLAAGPGQALRWRASSPADRYQLQVDDSCASPATCTFPSPEIDEPALTTPSYVPAPGALPYSTSAPVGRRYYWRVRACAGDDCGEWSVPRYVVAGRAAGALNTDVNGDGYPDLVVGAPQSSAVVQMGGQLFIYLGGPTLSSTPAAVISSDLIFDGLGSTVAMVGDVNGDGYGDFVAKTIGNESTPNVVPAPRALLFLGGATLPTQPAFAFTAGITNDDNTAAAGIGDVNGDGYDDFAVGGATISPNRTAVEPGFVQIYRGGPTFTDHADLTLSGSTQEFFGASIAGAGDVNGDGYPDLVVGSHEGASRVYVYFGGPSMDDTADVTLDPPQATAGYFGFSVALPGDLDGDGYDDVVVGAPGGEGAQALPAHAYVYFGGQHIHLTPDLAITSGLPGEWFAKIVAPAGDVNGDGFADLAVVARGAYVPAIDGRVPTGRRVDVFFGGSSVATTAGVTVPSGTSDPSPRGFAAADLDGDGLPELITGRWATDYHGMSDVAIFRGQDGYASSPSLVLSGAAPGDFFGAKLGR
ncbi:MAG TPA: FG-GAP-like repeat-containing protein [Polyangia bacterium]